MPSFSRGDIVRVPFPYTDRTTTQRRPALVVSAGGVGYNGLLIWVAMITSSENRHWPGDVAIDAPGKTTGLPIPSVVRTAKIATIEARVAEKIGSLQANDFVAVEAELRATLGLSD